MSRRITCLIAASTLVVGAAVAVPTATAAAPKHEGTHVSKTATTVSVPDPQQLITVLNQVEKRIQQAQSSGKMAPHDLAGLDTLFSSVEVSVLALLNAVTSTVGLPSIPGLPKSADLPAAKQLEKNVKAALAKVAPADLGGLGSLLGSVVGVVMGLLNTLTGLLGLPALPGLPPLPPLPPVGGLPIPPVPGS